MEEVAGVVAETTLTIPKTPSKRPRNEICYDDVSTIMLQP
jgi:hypothetical protein